MAEQEGIVAELESGIAVLSELRRMRDEARESITQNLNPIRES